MSTAIVSNVPTVLDLHDRGPVDVPPLFAHLVDDAALFPSPAAEPRGMPAALADHRAVRSAEHGGAVGFFLCQVSRLGLLIRQLREDPPRSPIPVSLIADTGLGGLPKAVSLALDNENLLQVKLVEVPASSDVDANWLVQLSEFVPDDVVRVVEPRRGRAGWLDGVRSVAEAGCWPKLRCGGASVESFPSIDEVAGFIEVASSLGRPFKATAGLHHAVRQLDEATGLTHHGLLNVIVASARSVFDGDVKEALQITDPEVLGAEVSALGEGASRAVRELFACFGSPSVSGALEELRAAKLL